MTCPLVLPLRKTLNQKILSRATWVAAEARASVQALESTLAKALPKGLANKVSLISTEAMPDQTSLAMQPVIPNLLWDWPAPSSGMISKDQFEFCDHMPKSSDPDANFASSGNSFSGNYFNFLEILGPGFKPQSMLESAKSYATLPAGSPGESNAPRGWTKVYDGAGLVRWQPDWMVDCTPNEFLASNSANLGQTSPIILQDSSILEEAITKGLSIFSYGKNPGDLTQPALKPGDIQQIEITAEAWGRVTLYPGDWYNSGLVTLGQNAPYIGKYSAKTVFGPGGLLSARVSEMIVAYNPAAVITLSQDFITNNKNKLLSANALELLGINLNLSGETSSGNPVSVSGRGGEYTVKIGTKNRYPAIIGVLIETPGHT